MKKQTTRDFPAAAHDRLDALIVASSANNQVYSDYAFAHNSILWRFRGVADSDDDFRKAYQLPTEGDCTEKTYLQERALFEFFAAFVSCIEVLCYCSYTIGTLSDPTTFPLATEDDRRNVTPKLTIKKFRRQHPTERIVGVLDAVVIGYGDADKMRNVLSHRGSPGRNVTVPLGSPQLSSTTWKAPSMSQPYLVDESLTKTNRKWLAQRLDAVLDALCEFAQRVLP